MRLTNNNLTILIQKIVPLMEFDRAMRRLNFPVRIRSVFIDQLALVFILILVGMPLFIFVLYTTIKDGQPALLEEYYWASFYACLPPAIYLNKDILFGQSIGKRICGLVIIDRTTQQLASPLKCVIRNLTMLLWPLEIIAVFVNPNRRLGDFIANTEITQALEVNDIPFPWIKTCLYLFSTICIVYLIDQIIQHWKV